MVCFMKFSFNIMYHKLRKLFNLKVTRLMVYTYPLKVSRKSVMVGIFHERIKIQLLSMVCYPLNMIYQKKMTPVFSGKIYKGYPNLDFLLRSP